MPSEFDDLDRELDLWAAAGRLAAFWWRDDDAVEPTPALTRLLGLSEKFSIEVGVAVIPARASDALADAFAPYPRAIALQHGYAHRNHAPPGEPAVECGGARPLGEIMGELDVGARRMEALFDARFPKILAAPWNRIEPPVFRELSGLGFRGASAAGPRAAMNGGNGFAVVNVHVDPIDWRGRRFAGNAKALSNLLGELRARRMGESDPDEPLGLLTHHLDHDEGMWEYLERLFAVTNAHRAARWLSISEAFELHPTLIAGAAR